MEGQSDFTNAQYRHIKHLIGAEIKQFETSILQRMALMFDQFHAEIDQLRTEIGPKPSIPAPAPGLELLPESTPAFQPAPTPNCTLDFTPDNTIETPAFITPLIPASPPNPIASQCTTSNNTAVIFAIMASIKRAFAPRAFTSPSPAASPICSIALYKLVWKLALPPNFHGDTFPFDPGGLNFNFPAFKHLQQA
ncbi:hypothetical protein MMC13_006922 [Lambiella insularis]|nr:hypothetical protein [Lambiella insularis]